MSKYVTGILAHVDSGKTTLAEALLYRSGKIRTQGRVDHKNTLLDNNEIERDRGITIFSKQAVFNIRDNEFTLLDTPGHADFSAETERTLSVLDYAILVISGTDGVQNHTETLWKLLDKYKIPVFIFVNKTDISEIPQNELMENIKEKLSDLCIDFSRDNDSMFFEELAMCGEELLESYTEHGCIDKSEMRLAIRSRGIFPCFFGSALKLTGIDEFISGFSQLVLPSDYPDAFGAKIYKITDDANGKRLTHMKITGGVLHVKDIISDEKVNEVRIYSGAKYENREFADSGTVCAVTGLSKTYAGQGLGFEADSQAGILEPVLKYRVEALDGTDIQKVTTALYKLQQEDPKLHVTWNAALKELTVQLMGEVQTEVLKRVVFSRFGINICFSEGKIAYKETIAAPVIGAGHYEPLKHYAEVHLLLKPLKRGGGLIFNSECSEDVLDRNKQNLILTHLKEKTHKGALTGSPITDMKITLKNGRAHIKHTEGGDFRQATYRAVRQGLRYAQSVLLEPWFNFTLTIPSDLVGRAMTDIQRMSGNFSQPDVKGEFAVITGCAPASEMQGYHSDVTEYTRGKGSLNCIFKGYDVCHNTDEVIETIGYNADSDTENTADSVFCSHGAGYTVKWDEADSHMSISVNRNEPSSELNEPPVSRVKKYIDSIAADKELIEIFERTYGPIKRLPYSALYTKKSTPKENKVKIKSVSLPGGDEYLLIDGYNVIFAWEDLKAQAAENLDYARHSLINIICNYQGFRQGNVILVFDAYKVKGSVREVEKIHNINVVYTKEAETADMYIEKVTHEIGKKHRVRVVTSDNLEQLIVLGSGAVRVSADNFLQEIKQTQREIKDFLYGE